MARVRKTQIWIEQNTTSTLTEYTAQVNSMSLERSVEILEDTTLNDNDRSVLPGIRSARLPLNGFYDTQSTSIVDNLTNMQGTSVSSTWQIKMGADYYYGECFAAGLTLGAADGKALLPWSTTLEVDGAVNKTSVSQA